MAKKSKAVVEVDDDLDELEELEEAAPPRKSKAKAPAPKKARPTADDDEESQAYGAAWLADYVNEQTGKEYTGANIRVLLRKMAKNGDLDREVGVDRSRYEFSGPNDPIVKAVLKYVKEGAIEKDKAERLAEVKSRKADAAKTDKPGKKAKKAAPVEDDDDEVETPAPKKKATRRRG